MIKNIVFDIENVILKLDVEVILNGFKDYENDRKVGSDTKCC